MRSLSSQVERLGGGSSEAALGEDNSEAGAIVGLTICTDRLDAGTPRLLAEYEIRAYSNRGRDDRLMIGIIN